LYSRNFFQYLKKLVFIRENNDRDGLGILKMEIEKNMEISQKKWLLEKLNELENILKK
jgi:hypothetical protein